MLSKEDNEQKMIEMTLRVDYHEIDRKQYYI